MVETALVTEDIAVGAQALEALDQERVGVRSAFWLYDRDAEEHRLFLALPEVDRNGPASAYKVVRRALAKHRVDLPIWRVVVGGVKEPLPQTVHRLVGLIDNGQASSSRARLGRRVVDGLTIDDAYIYRST